MEASELVSVNGLENVTLLLGDSWLGQRTRLAFALVEFLAIKKKFVQIVVLASGAMLEFPSRPNRMLEVNDDTTQADVYKAVARVIASRYNAKLYKDKKRNIPLSFSEAPLGPIDNGTLYIDILESFDSWKCLKTLQGHGGYVNSVAFSPDGTTVVSGSHDNTLKLWSVSGGECLNTLQDWDCVFGVAFSPNGRTVVSCSEKVVKLWSVSSGKCLNILHGHSSGVCSVAFSPDGRTVVSGSHDNTLKLWSVSGGECVKTLHGHSHSVQSVAVSPNGKTVVSGSYDNTLKLWSVSGGGECLKTLHDHTSCVNSVAFSPDGRTVVSASTDQTLKLWSVSGGECLKTFQDHRIVWSAAFSPDGRTIVSGSYDDTLKLWSVSTAECLKVLSGPLNCVKSVAFSPDGRSVVAGSKDKTVTTWSAPS